MDDQVVKCDTQVRMLGRELARFVQQEGCCRLPANRIKHQQESKVGTSNNTSLTNLHILTTPFYSLIQNKAANQPGGVLRTSRALVAKHIL
jgi:hypothetical protein